MFRVSKKKYQNITTDPLNKGLFFLFELNFQNILSNGRFGMFS